MKKWTKTAWLVAVVGCGIHIAASAQPEVLRECQKIKDKIDHYNELRRAGGSGAKMDAWKRARRKLEKKFRDAGCRDYLGELQ